MNTSREILTVISFHQVHRELTETDVVLFFFVQQHNERYLPNILLILFFSLHKTVKERI